jgi:hypothetical protein
MQLGIDFDGTKYHYRVCRKSGSGDGWACDGFDNLEDAKKCIARRKRDDKKIGCKYRYWIVKETRTYERVFDTEPNESYKEIKDKEKGE